MKKKYELTKEAKILNGKTLYRIKAIRNFGKVRKGDLGGYVEKESNLAHYGDCWIGEDAVVMGNAVVKGHAVVKGYAVIEGYAIVRDYAIVKEDAVVEEDAIVRDRVVVEDNAIIGDRAVIRDRAVVRNCAIVEEDAVVMGNAVVKGHAIIGGYAVIDDKSPTKSDSTNKKEPGDGRDYAAKSDNTNKKEPGDGRDYTAKNDQGKTMWSIIPWRPIEQAAEIMTNALIPKSAGGKGYGLASWHDVPGGFFRYWDALLRHCVRRFVFGEIIDPDSGKHHMAHVICNAMFVCSRDIEALEKGEFDPNFYERDIK